MIFKKLRIVYMVHDWNLSRTDRTQKLLEKSTRSKLFPIDRSLPDEHEQDVLLKMR